MKKSIITSAVYFSVLSFCIPLHSSEAAYHFDSFRAKPPIHIAVAGGDTPTGLAPADIRNAYNLPDRGGKGTIALIESYNDPALEHDLNIFSDYYGLPRCTRANHCFESHFVDGRSSKGKSNSGWALETSLDVEWAHAIAPDAKILVVEAATPSGQHLLDAIDYARNRSDVVAVSMSWGGHEFVEEANFEDHFTADHDVAFFAASGDRGTGVSWPSASANVIAVGGSVLQFGSNGSVDSETAWLGSGGGLSEFIPEPSFQKEYRIPRTKGMRAVPDVAFHADQAMGYSVYDSVHHMPERSWFKVGGTSAGAPQWAAIYAIDHSAMLEHLYADKASKDHARYFRDIISGSNGNCGYYCNARKRYDFITGLGSPLTVTF